MSSENKNCYTLTLKLETEQYQIDYLNRVFSIGEYIYNRMVKQMQIQLKRLEENHYYQRLRREYRELMPLVEKDKEELRKYNKEHQTKFKKTKNIRRQEVISKELHRLQSELGITKSDLEKYGKLQQHKYKKFIDANTVQKIAFRVWGAVKKYLTSNGKRVHFKKFKTLTSLEGKSNKQGLRFKDNWLVWDKVLLKPIIRKTDVYAQEALATSSVKYCRLLRKTIKGKDCFFIQLVLDGTPPPKRHKDGSFKRKLGTGTVGLDIGTSSLAVASDTKCLLTELASGIENYDRELRLLRRKLDRSRRATNPNNYNENGTIKRGVKLDWKRSNSYMKTLFRIKELSRKRATLVKQSHEALANEVILLGDQFYIETMNFKALQKRSKETKKSEKTGKFLSKKRFGKSLANHSPSAFVNILERKLKYFGKKLNQVNTQTFKASQYNHFTDEYIKKELSNRWNDFEGIKIQRDLYSAFLLKNSKKDLKTTNRKLCLTTFEAFKPLHDECIEELKMNSTIKRLSSFGI